MSAKYPTPKPHVHSELIKAWANGAIVEVRYSKDVWDTLMFSDPLWTTSDQYRIYPECDYAKAKIAELGGDDMVELYLYWLDGGGLVCYSYKIPNYPPEPNQDPFSEFINLLNTYITITKKKRMVKQVLWVHEWSGENHMHDCKWLPEDYSQPLSKGWHKVPSCTRDVEAND